MAVQYAPSKLRVPEGFNNLLEGLTREVLREQPENIIRFASEYFKTQMKLRAEGANGAAAVPVESAKDEAPAAVEPVANVEVATDEAKPADESPSDESPKSETESETPAADEPAAEAPAVGKTLSEEEAAMKIQAVVRGKKARNEVKEMKAGAEDGTTTEVAAVETEAETPAESASEAEAEKPAAEEEASNPEEEAAAAIKIQASFRGMQARKEVEAMKENANEGEGQAEDAKPAAEETSGQETSPDA